MNSYRLLLTLTSCRYAKNYQLLLTLTSCRHDNSYQLLLTLTFCRWANNYQLLLTLISYRPTNNDQLLLTLTSCRRANRASLVPGILSRVLIQVSCFCPPTFRTNRLSPGFDVSKSSVTSSSLRSRRGTMDCVLRDVITKYFRYN